MQTVIDETLKKEKMQKSNFNILIVDDEPDITELLEYNLSKEGYQVYTASNGKKAIEVAEKIKPDLILLDIMMPEMDGIQTCKAFREIESLNNTHIIFLTARIEEYTEIAGFSAGADDYITKPIKPAALISRINSVYKKKQKEDVENSELNIADLNINRLSYKVTYKGQSLHFARKEFELLFLLASNEGNVLNRDTILQKVWGNGVFVGDRTIDVHIRKIREKINPDYIQTIKGIGYKFEV